MEHVINSRTNNIPDVGPVFPVPDNAPEWRFCVKACEKHRSDRACPLMTSYLCSRCPQPYLLAYLIHGLNSRIKRRFYGDAKVIHIRPNFQTGDRIFCCKCARIAFPGIERRLGKTFEQLWRARRDFDHICEEVEMDPYSTGCDTKPSYYANKKT